MGKDMKSPTYLLHPVLTFAKDRQTNGNYELAKERNGPYQKPKNAGDLYIEQLMREEAEERENAQNR
jgi:hypothetical protein